MENLSDKNLNAQRFNRARHSRAASSTTLIIGILGLIVIVAVIAYKFSRPNTRVLPAAMSPSTSSPTGTATPPKSP
jgi:hypothetical protein